MKNKVHYRIDFDDTTEWITDIQELKRVLNNAARTSVVSYRVIYLPIALRVLIEEHNKKINQ